MITPSEREQLRLIEEHLEQDAPELARMLSEGKPRRPVLAAVTGAVVFLLALLGILTTSFALLACALVGGVVLACATLNPPAGPRGYTYLG